MPIAIGDNFKITAEGTFITQKGGGTMLVRDGRETILEPQGTTDPTTLSAWLESDDKVIIDESDVPFAPLTTLSAETRVITTNTVK